MDAEKEARRREYLELKAAKEREIQYFQDLDQRARLKLAELQEAEERNKIKSQIANSKDPDLKNAEPIMEDPNDRLYGYKEAKEKLKKAIELQKNKKYLESLNKKNIMPEPDFTKSMGKTAGGLMNQLTDKLSPLAAKDEEEGDYSATNLMDEADAPFRALNVLDNVTGRPVRRFAYEMLGGEPKKEVEGSDIRQQLETKTGRLNDIVGKPLELAADFGLDWTNFMPILGAAAVGRKLATKFATNPETLEHIASIAAKKAKDADVLKQSEDLYKGMKERPDAFRAAPGLPKDVTFQENFSHLPTRDDVLSVLKGEADDAAARAAYKAEFDVNPTVYHGSPHGNIKKFIPSKYGVHGEGIYTTTIPELSNPYTEGYWSKDPTLMPKNVEPTIYPLKYRGRTFDVHNPQDWLDLIRVKKPSYSYPDIPFKKNWYTHKDIQPELTALGNLDKALKESNLFTAYKDNDLIKILDPKNIRSPFAKFDPAMKESGDILAGFGGAGLVGASTMSSPEANASEMKSPSKDDILKTLLGEE